MVRVFFWLDGYQGVYDYQIDTSADEITAFYLRMSLTTLADLNRVCRLCYHVVPSVTE